MNHPDLLMEKEKASVLLYLPIAAPAHLCGLRLICGWLFSGYNIVRNGKTSEACLKIQISKTNDPLCRKVIKGIQVHKA